MARAKVIAALFAVLLCALLTGCGAASQPGEVRVAAFNIQIFGVSKLAKPGVADVLADIIREYDVVLVQEIRDSSETAIYELVDLVNKKSPGDYSVAVSERLGRSNSKEQYAYVYRVSKLLLTSVGTYPDSGDVFEREPFFANFKTVAEFPFALVGLHSKPDDAVAELDKMGDVRNHVKGRVGHDNIIMLGDFNADCDYVRASEFADISIFNDDSLHTYIATGVDTTTGNSHCAYDRFVVTAPIKDRLISAGVFHFDSQYSLSSSLVSDISDHYPIYIVIEAEELEWTTVYATDFENGADSYWTDTAKTETHAPVSGRSGTHMLGRYGEDDFVRFIIEEGDSILPPDAQYHEWRISFLLHVIGSWNGRPPAGPDSFKVLNVLSTVFETTFCNSEGTDRQDFPNAINKGSAPCRTASLAQDTLGFGDGTDTTYRMSLRFFIEDPMIRLRFSGKLLSSSGFESIESESWAMDDFKIEWAPHDCTHSRKRYCQITGLLHETPLSDQKQHVVVNVPLTAVEDIKAGATAEEVAAAVAVAGVAVKLQTAAMVVVSESDIALLSTAPSGAYVSVLLEMYEEHATYLRTVLSLDVPELENTYLKVATITFSEPFTAEPPQDPVAPVVVVDPMQPVFVSNGPLGTFEFQVSSSDASMLPLPLRAFVACVLLFLASF